MTGLRDSGRSPRTTRSGVLKVAALIASALLLASFAGGFSWGGDEDTIAQVG